MKKLLVVLLALLVGISVIACSKDSADTGESKVLNSIKERGVLKVGTEAGYPPFEFTVIEDGQPKIVGIDIEIGQMIADKIGVDLEIVDMEFGTLIEAVSVGDVDIVLAGMNPSEERKEAVDFSNVYYTDDQVILIRKENAAELTSIESFDGKMVGVQMGTLQETIAEENFVNSEILSLPKIADLVMELKTGAVDGVLVGGPTAVAYENEHEDIVIPDIKLGSEADTGVAAAFAKGNQPFVDIVNEVLNEIMEDGTLDNIIKENSILAGIEEE